MKTDQIISASIYGHLVKCRILAVHPFGTIDVERLLDGKCFRLTGLFFG